MFDRLKRLLKDPEPVEEVAEAKAGFERTWTHCARCGARMHWDKQERWEAKPTVSYDRETGQRMIKFYLVWVCPMYSWATAAGAKHDRTIVGGYQSGIEPPGRSAIEPRRPNPT